MKIDKDLQYKIDETIDLFYRNNDRLFKEKLNGLTPEEMKYLFEDVKKSYPNDKYIILLRVHELTDMKYALGFE